MSENEAGIAEMLLQSHEGNSIRVLPALPTAWKNGHVTGLKARGGTTVDIYWSNNKLDKVILKSRFNNSIDLIYNDSVVPLSILKDKTLEYTHM